MPGGVGGARVSLASTRFCERRGVRLPPATHLVLGFQHQSDAERFRKDLERPEPGDARQFPSARPP